MWARLRPAWFSRAVSSRRRQASSSASTPGSSSCTAHPMVCSAMVDMVEPLLEQGGDVVVVQVIEDLAAILAGADEAQLAQAAHVMGNCGFADACGGGEGADVELALAGQGGDDADA